MSKVELIATATFAMESVVAHELRQLGYTEQRVENNEVRFWADTAAIVRSNLWLRTADRVKLVVGRFDATTFTDLFEGTKSLPWENWLPVDAEFPVQGKSVKSQLFSVSDCQAIVKKAIVDRLQQTYKKSWFPETGPLFPIEVSLLKDTATITIDTSGEALHKRGYRRLVSQAPLRETMAAGLIQLSFWQPSRPFLDPFCGSGTLPIEAALMGCNMAPGLHRSLAAEQWPWLPRQLWQRAREEAHDVIVKQPDLQIAGTDIDGQILKAARQNAAMAGVDEHIHFQQMPVSEVRSSRSYGVMICNPPYGERLSDRDEVVQIYRSLQEVMSPLETWSFYVLTAYPDFEHVVGRVADRRRKLYNGNIECQYYQFFGPRPPQQYFA